MSKIIKPTAPNPPWPDGVADENTRRVLLPLVQTHITRNGDTDERFITMRDLRREIGPQLTDLGVITEGRGVTKADVMTIVSDVGYTRSKLQADLSGGVQRIVAGVGSDGRLVVDSATGHVVMMHKDVVYDGYSSIADALNIRLPAIALTPAGIAMGYNDTDGQWVNSVAIEASTGNAWFSGTVNALSGNFAEGITIGGTGITLG